MFERFSIEDIAVTDAVVHVRHGGDGLPVVLLHGHPRTGATWHRVAPLLAAEGRKVVVPDLRGYGASRGPAPTANHQAASKRAMAADIIETMTHLGHERFDLVGHDRGSYVALRLALDHPDRVNRIALLDCLPITEHLDRITPEFATQWFHWFFFAQPDVPERVINADPEAWYNADAQVMGHENHAEWLRAIHNPAVVRAMLEDYRAGLTVDRAAEEADRSAGRKVEVPLLVLWSLRDDLEQLFGDPLSIWRTWATNVRGHGIDSGHHVAEEAPRGSGQHPPRVLRLQSFAKPIAKGPSETRSELSARPKSVKSTFWNANALAKAKTYRDQMSMSPAAIHDQLTSAYGEKFTPAEADYAIQHLND